MKSQRRSESCSVRGTEAVAVATTSLDATQVPRDREECAIVGCSGARLPSGIYYIRHTTRSHSGRGHHSHEPVDSRAVRPYIGHWRTRVRLGEASSRMANTATPKVFSLRQRCFMVLLGVAGVAAGAVAVYRNHNGNGTAVLIIVAAVLALFGLIGRITSFRMGDWEAVVGEALEEAKQADQAAAQAQQTQRQVEALISEVTASPADEQELRTRLADLSEQLNALAQQRTLWEQRSTAAETGGVVGALLRRAVETPAPTGPATHTSVEDGRVLLTLRHPNTLPFGAQCSVTDPNGHTWTTVVRDREIITTPPRTFTAVYPSDFRDAMLSPGDYKVEWRLNPAPSFEFESRMMPAMSYHDGFKIK